MKIINLKTESLITPLAIDLEFPAFSWAIEAENYMQKSYRIRVATDVSLLDNPDMWDSGVVLSNQCLHILYAGKKLESLKVYYWQVEVDGVLSAYSYFETGPSDMWVYADWSGMPFALEGGTDLLRVDFSIDKPVKRARFYCANETLSIK